VNDLSWFREHHAENMERMFAAVGDLYAEYWNDFFHFALFEQGDDDWDEAFRRTHRRYASALRLGPKSEVLELACGRGGFADFLAAETGADVLGIDISRAQLRRARAHERPNLEFRHHDIMRVDELGRRFDAVVLMDADIYLPDKRAAVEKISRVMKPGARFLLIAWCRREGLSALQEEVVLHPFLRYWGAPGLETPSAYRAHFEAAGLDLLEQLDLNDKVRRNWDFGYDKAIEAVRDFSLAKAAKLVWQGLPLGREAIRLIKEQFPAALYIKAGFDAGFLRYTYFLTRKKPLPAGRR
jgi:cyclopropane fatty-acyl-phospholipid synthase-like methyltransferase